MLSEAEVRPHRVRGWLRRADDPGQDLRRLRRFVDRLIDLVGELVINQAMLAQRVTEAGMARDFDKLVLDVETKPSITPRDALASAGATLRNLVGLVADMSEEQVGLELGEVSPTLATSLGLDKGPNAALKSKFDTDPAPIARAKRRSASWRLAPSFSWTGRSYRPPSPCS